MTKAKTPKTRWTFEEARKAAFKQFPVDLNRYEISRATGNDDDSTLGYLLVDFLDGKKTWFDYEAKTEHKLTRAFVRSKLQEYMERVFEANTIRRWCDANRIQRYQVDSAVWFEAYGKPEVAA
jgi:hypothetical protein